MAAGGSSVELGVGMLAEDSLVAFTVVVAVEEEDVEDVTITVFEALLEVVASVIGVLCFPVAAAFVELVDEVMVNVVDTVVVGVEADVVSFAVAAAVVAVVLVDEVVVLLVAAVVNAEVDVAMLTVALGMGGWLEDDIDGMLLLDGIKRVLGANDGDGMGVQVGIGTCAAPPATSTSSTAASCSHRMSIL